MKGNVGIIDRIIRVALVVVVAVLFFTGQLSLVASIILGALAVVFLLTSVVGVCPLYLLFGISSKKKPAAQG
jgi:hypothetical protein